MRFKPQTAALLMSLLASACNTPTPASIQPGQASYQPVGINMQKCWASALNGVTNTPPCARPIEAK